MKRRHNILFMISVHMCYSCIAVPASPSLAPQILSVNGKVQVMFNDIVVNISNARVSAADRYICS